LNLPTGTVTFLFTDIEGSTRLWQDQPDAMRVALARHNSLVADAIDRAGGHVFKTIGDAYCAAFERADEAVNAAAAAQHALLTEPWPEGAAISARMSLHTGTIKPDGDDYFGPPLNRVARLLAVGHGGQTLLSGTTESLCRDTLPAGCTLKPLGEHRLKDLRRPESVYQLCHPALPSEFPALRSVSATEVPNNLPQQSTSFVGREDELAEVAALTSSARLVTLTGSGGCGKTRLANQVAAQLMPDYPDGVWLVELAALTEAILVPAEIASCVGVGEEPGLSVERALTNALKRKKMLLVLDNCEHVIESAAQISAELLRACPDVKVLATSREHLAVPGEHAYRVPSLEIPRSLKAGVDPTEYAAVRLFRDRAQASDTGFQITEQNAAAVVSICERLDGMPLPIELAAARVRSMPVSQIATRLDDRFSLLTKGSRTALPRQQTLRALVDWSWELLAPEEQVLLRRVAIFADGFTLEAAEAVCADRTETKSHPCIRESDVMDLLSQLVDKALITPDPRDDWPRYRLLETVRYYGLERLEVACETAILRSRHFEWVLVLALDAEKHLDAPDMQDWLNQLELDHANIRAALAHGVSGEQSLHIAVALHRFWFVRGHLTVGRELLAAALDAAGDCKPALRAKALNQVGIFAWRLGDYAAAEPYIVESLKLRREIGDRTGEGAALNNLGMLMDDRGDSASARNAYELAAAIYRDLGDRAYLGMVLANLAICLMDMGDLDAAEASAREFVLLAQETGDPWNTATALHNLGEVALKRGNDDEAARLMLDSLPVLADLGDTPQVLQVLLACGRLAAARGKLEAGAALFAAVESIHESEGIFLRELDIEELKEAKERVRSIASSDEFAAWWECGVGLDLAAAVQLALSAERRPR
jgi:predicted ATPase/class 3 adenylate cyclase